LLSLNLLVGGFLTTMVMLIPTSLVKDKVAVSSLVLALLVSTVNSALVPPEDVLRLEEVVVLALLILDLITANGFIPLIVMIAKIPMPILMLDSQVSKPSEELLELNASRVPLTVNLPVLKPVSASNILAVEVVAVLS